MEQPNSPRILSKSQSFPVPIVPSKANSPQARLRNTRWAIASGMLGLALGGWNSHPVLAQATVHQPLPQQPVLLVNPILGQDSASGNAQTPLKTITRALQLAQPGTVIQLQRGTYSRASGEMFPLRLPAGVTLRGENSTRGQDIVIQGGGEWPTASGVRNVSLAIAQPASIDGVTVSNPQGYGIWIEAATPSITDSTFTGCQQGIGVVAGAPKILNNFFYQNRGVGLLLSGNSRAEIRDNIFEEMEVGIEVRQQAQPLMVSNRITQSHDGVVIADQSQPILRQNSIEANRHDGVRVEAQARPNLGTAEDPGANRWVNNGKADLEAEAAGLVAVGNTQGKLLGVADTPPGPLDAAVGSGNPARVAASPRGEKFAKVTATIPTPALSTLVPVALPPATSLPVQPVAVIPRSAGLTTPGSVLGPISGSVPGPIPSSMPGPIPGSTNPAPSQAASISASAFPVPLALAPEPPSDSGAIAARYESAIRPISQPAARPIARLVGNPVLSQQLNPRSTASSPVSSLAASPGPTTFLAQTVRFNTPAPALITTQPDASEPLIPALNPTFSPVLPRAVPSPGAPLSAAPSSRSTTTGPIMIPVPPPETAAGPLAISVSPSRSTVVLGPQTTPLELPASPSGGQGNVLPVPSPDIPIGSIGDMDNIYRGSLPSALAGLTGGSAETVAQAASQPAPQIHYRVIVEVWGADHQAQIQTLVPEAFVTLWNGRSVLQAGAFGDRTKALQLAQFLGAQGIPAMIEQL